MERLSLAIQMDSGRRKPQCRLTMPAALRLKGKTPPVYPRFFKAGWAGRFRPAPVPLGDFKNPLWKRGDFYVNIYFIWEMKKKKK